MKYQTNRTIFFYNRVDDDEGIARYLIECDIKDLATYERILWNSYISFYLDLSNPYFSKELEAQNMINACYFNLLNADDGYITNIYSSLNTNIFDDLSFNPLPKRDIMPLLQ